MNSHHLQPREATFAAQGITMAHYMEGAAYTVGPTGNLSIRNSSMLRNFGGEVLCDATVEQIIIEDGRAVGVLVRNTSAGQDGPITEIRAKNIVCATSVFNLHNKLLPQDHPSVKEFRDETKRTIKPSNGHVFLFCKIRGEAEELELPRHNLWYFNSYDMDQAFDQYYADPVTHRPPTVYIGFPWVFYCHIFSIFLVMIRIYLPCLFIPSPLVAAQKILHGQSDYQAYRMQFWFQMAYLSGSRNGMERMYMSEELITNRSKNSLRNTCLIFSTRLFHKWRARLNIGL